MIYFNKDKLRDRILACWIGKNIGGTMGAPFEGKQDVNDIDGFTTPPGEALPNDDLDLQLVWLKAMYDVGPDALNSKVLGEYWRECVGPQWNEYGVCKGNLSGGIIPPMSGELNNDAWKHSNGAWIRTEVWACTNPGCVEKAIRLAFEDASVDHGFGEGSYGTIFVAAMESAAFLIDDVNALIDIGLSKIPEDCLVSKLVRLVKKAYSDGLDWKSARELVVENNTLGWFQAPNNIAFAVIGLLWGGCDFKKSMIIAVDCGDDTDCTAATVGALLGIMHGTAGIPDDWRGYIGDGIKTVAVIRGNSLWPKTCTELTDSVMNMIPAAVRCGFESSFCGGDHVVIGDGEDDFGGVDVKKFYGDGFVKRTFCRSPYSFTTEGTFFSVLTEFEREPQLTAGEQMKIKISLVPNGNCISHRHYSLRWFLPDGWTVDGKKSLFLCAPAYPRTENDTVTVTLTAGETAEAQNRLVLEVACEGCPTPVFVPILILS